jgi:hypothetical protein
MFFFLAWRVWRRPLVGTDVTIDDTLACKPDALLA